MAESFEERVEKTRQAAQANYFSKVNAAHPRLFADQQQPKQSEQPRVPKPDTMPAASPAADLKNRVVIQHQYSPEAAQALYETPLRIRYGDMRLVPEGSEFKYFGGYYRPPYDRIVMGGQNLMDSPPEEVLAHEFAHKWQADTMNPLTRESWDNVAADIVSSRALDAATGRAEAGEFEAPSTTEMYAHNVERGGWDLNDKVKNAFYPGLYKQQMNPPRPVPPQVQNPTAWDVAEDRSHTSPMSPAIGYQQGDMWARPMPQDMAEQWPYKPIGYGEPPPRFPSIYDSGDFNYPPPRVDTTRPMSYTQMEQIPPTRINGGWAFPHSMWDLVPGRGRQNLGMTGG